MLVRIINKRYGREKTVDELKDDDIVCIKCDKCGADYTFLYRKSKQRGFELCFECLCHSHAMTPEEKKLKRNERRRIHAQDPEIKLARKIRDSLPENRAKYKARKNQPHRKIRRKAYTSSLEYKERRAPYYASRRSLPANRKYQREYKKARRADPQYQLEKNLSSAIRKSLRGNKKGRKWETLVDWTAEELKQHLESLWKPGMSWDNYGDWHIDHKIPESWWKYANANDSEFKQCWALANLQPLWGKDNLIKGNRMC